MSQKISKENKRDFGLGMFISSNFWLVVGLLAALWAANFHTDIYHIFAHGSIEIGYPEIDLKTSIPVHFLVVEILMTCFFFVIGAELKIDFTDSKYGAFKKTSDIIAPGAGAIGGILLPAGICVIIAGDMASKAFGVPMATDIAFTLALANMFGMTKEERSFLKALAVIDDIIGVVVIAVFYGNGLDLMTVSIAIAGIVILLFIGWKLKVQSVGIYIVGMIILWELFHKAGIHPTLAGVVAGFAAPHSMNGRSIAKEIEHSFNLWMQPMVLGLFALISCGIEFSGLLDQNIHQGVFWGISLGLFIGKPVGIFIFLFLLAKVLPKFSATFKWSRIWAMGSLAGFGFTVALFVNGLAFVGLDSIIQTSGILGIYAGSIASVLLGGILCIWSRKDRIYT